MLSPRSPSLLDSRDRMDHAGVGDEVDVPDADALQLPGLLHTAVARGASDLLIAAGATPMLRIGGELTPVGSQELTPESAQAICLSALNDDQKITLTKQQDVDFAMTLDGTGRFRVNVHLQKNSCAAAIRCIPADPPALESLNLPPAVEFLTRLHHGLVLVTGQTGSGKTTTLAAIIDVINRRDAKHVITLEDPIEFLHPHRRALVEQREIGADCPSFASGLKHVLRQDPDVILVGELRDLETIRIAIQAAETGHLVLATLHSTTAAGAIERIIEVFPSDEQSQVRTHLAESLQGVITQQLLPGLDVGSRVAALEILLRTRAVRTSIREGTPHLLAGVMQTGRKIGMQTMEQAVAELGLNGLISAAVAREYSKEQQQQDT